MPSTDHPGRVLLAFPSTGHDISTRFMRSLAELDAFDREYAVASWEAMGAPESPNPIDLRLLHNWFCVEATANIAKARNRLVDEFLHNDDFADCQWLWFCDTDMVFEPDTLLKMIARAVTNDLKILGALAVIVGADGVAPTLFEANDTTITQLYIGLPEPAVFQVAATGTGCLLVHRSVFQKMYDDSSGSTNCWFGFDIRVGDTGREWQLGEDVSFCLRAGEAGFPTYVDSTLHVGHHKGPRVWYPKDVEWYPMQSDEFGRIGDENTHA
jgi:hypothetical protein